MGKIAKQKKRGIAFILTFFVFCVSILPADSLAQAASKSSTVTHVTVHDPSVVKDTKTGRYYIFGSHLAWAYSDDLQNWKTFRNNINTEYRTLFKDGAEWAKLGDKSYNVYGNMWAPDVIWNPTMQKWCMYMSVNGCSWNSSIALLTADSLDGDWSYQGTVVYSGFTKADYSHDYTKTDYVKVTGDAVLPDRYIGRAYTCRDGQAITAPTTWNTAYGAHAIDPCVFYGGDGKLYMTYGSWSGGIYMLQLDGATGLRDYSVTYALAANQSDPYMGYKIAGGSNSSGEGSYIQKIGDYYYLFVTYGGLTANGGYNMRVFRSKEVTGPYKDKKGDDARFTKYVNNINGTVGNRLMSYYQWSYAACGYAAEGHNSVYADEKGAYVVYHTRGSDTGEKHQVRVHQLFTTEDGWLVAAPFEYSGEALNKKLKASDIKGSYEVIFQKSTSYGLRECNKGITLHFKTNGKITGDKTGTWKWSKKLGAPYVTMKIAGKTYQGVFVKQRMEDKSVIAGVEGTAVKLGKSTMAFTILGSDEIAVWGYNMDTTYSKTKPVLTSAKSVSNGIRLKWSKKLGASGYYIYRKTGNGKWKKIKTVTNSKTVKYIDKKAKKGSTYKYRIRAYSSTKKLSDYSVSLKATRKK